MRLATTLLSPSPRWSPPKWADDPICINALLNGALGPDMGYFPGADLLLGELAHYVRPGLLVREMVRNARSDIEQAYAWGWATHLVADIDAHTSVVNRRCGELLNGTRNSPVAYAESPGTHLAVETGLDAFLLARSGRDDPVRLERVLDSATVPFLVEAYRAAYGLEVPESRLLRSHRAVVRFQPTMFRVLATIGRYDLGAPLSWADRLRLAVYIPLRWLTAPLSHSNRVRGTARSDRPPEWVIARLDALEAGFPSAFLRHLESDFEGLLEVNADTGGHDDGSYPFSARARRRLRARGGDDL